MDLKPEITWLDFEKLDIRCGTIISVADFPEAKKTIVQTRNRFWDAWH